MWRTEIQPTQQQLRDRFLVVLSPTIDQPSNGNVREIETSHEEVIGVETPNSSTIFLPTGFKQYPVEFTLNRYLSRLRVVNLSRQEQLTISCLDSAPVSTGSVIEYALNFPENGTHNAVSCSIFAKE